MNHNDDITARFLASNGAGFDEEADEMPEDYESELLNDEPPPCPEDGCKGVLITEGGTVFCSKCKKLF